MLPQGSVLRDYTIEEVLGHGGFGIVYKARHNELDHVVAIKEYLPSELAVREGTTVRARSADCETYFADGLRRFRDEARALIDFQQHPSIVDCRDFFRANGTAYLVMEYVEGLPLSELLRQREDAGRPFTESDLLGIAIPLAEGLAHIHRAGVIHRDIKPANILVRRSDQQPVLIDFGAAKQAVAEHSRSLAPYTEGYAALEQVAEGQLGPWTDLYGFGAVLWRMVAGGNRPWNPPNPVKVESRANAGLRDAEDPLPTAKELGAGRFADRLLELIDGCLQLKDTDRIRDSDRVLQVLRGSGEGGSPQSATAGQPAEGGHGVDRTDPVSEEPRTGRSSGRRLWKVVGVAAVIAMAVALSTVALGPRNGTVEPPDRWSFSIEAEPSTATVALPNGPEAYRPGMLLPPGQYEVQVSAPGFVTHRERVDHSETETRHQVQLEVVPDVGPEVAQTPSEAATSPTQPITRPPATPEVAQTPSEAATESSDSTAVEQERVSSNVSDAEQSVAEVQPEPVQTPPEENSEAANATTEASEQVRREVSDASKTLVTDSVPASDNEKTDTKGLSPSNCGDSAGGWTKCFQLGESYRKADGVPRDLARAAESYQQACEGGVAMGCVVLGGMYYEGEGVGRDHARAAEIYQQACEAGATDGCGNLGSMYESGHGVPLDRARAAKLYEQACEGGGAIGCRRLGFLHREGEGVPQDPKRAAELFGRACESEDAAGCRFLGSMYEEGDGVPLDRAQAAQLYGRACKGGDAAGCRILGIWYKNGEGVPQDRARAAQLFELACDGEDNRACHNLGSMYGKGEGVPMDRALAAEFYKQACGRGSLGSCNNLGLLHDHGHGVGKDQVYAAELFHRACEGGIATGCFNLGNSFYEGKGVRQDWSRAAELYRRACDGDSMSACHNLGHSYYQGDGVRQDRSVAASLFRKACANGNQGACETLEKLGWR